MPPSSQFPAKTLVAQFNKRDQTGNEGAGGGDNNSPVAILGLIITALTLLVAIPAYKHESFAHLLSLLLPSQFVNFFRNHILRIHKAITLWRISNSTPPQSDPLDAHYVFINDDHSNAALVFIYNDYSGAGFSGFAGARSTSASYQNDNVSRRDMKHHTATTTGTRPSLAPPPLLLGRANTVRLLDSPFEAS